MTNLPDIEIVSAKVHEAWMDSKLKAGVTTRKLETGEELMVPYGELSEAAKELDRGTVKAVYAAIIALAIPAKAEAEPSLWQPCSGCYTVDECRQAAKCFANKFPELITKGDKAPSPREYLKIKYSAPSECCKCGNCQLVPPDMLASWAAEIENILPTRDELTQLVCNALWGPRDIGFRNNEVKEAGSRVADAILGRLSAKAEAEVGMRKALEPLRIAGDEWEHWRVRYNVPDYEMQRYSAKINVADLLKIRAALANLPAKTETAVEKFQKRVVKMIGEGFRGFHFTAGPKWETMTDEQRCAFILEMWDARKTPLDFKDSYRKAVNDVNRMNDKGEIPAVPAKTERAAVVEDK